MGASCRNGHRNFAQFDKEVRMWVFEEVYQGRKLSEVINSTHENVSLRMYERMHPMFV